MRRMFQNQAVGDLLPVYLIMTVVLFANFMLEPSLLSVSGIRDLAVQLAPYVLTAVAQTMVALLAGVDLATGSIVSLASTIVATSLGRGGVDVLVVLGVLALCASLGVATGAFVAVLRVPALVVTLAASFVWSGVALLVLPQPGGSFPEADGIWITGVLFGVPLVVVIVAIPLVAWLLVRRSAIGLRLYAVGNSPSAARLTGLSVVRAHLWAFGLSGLFAALAGVVISAQTGSGDPTVGTPFTLSSIASAVIGGVSLLGGRGRIAGAVAGAVIIGMLVNLLLYAGVSSFAQYVVQGLILFAIVAFTALRHLRRTRREATVPSVGATSGAAA